MISIKHQIAAILGALTLLLGAPLHGKVKWVDVAPEDLAATESKTSPGADAEIIFSRHVMDSDKSENWTENHIQAKIYTQKGVEQASLFAIEYTNSYKISELAARIIKANGSVVELNKENFHEATVVKSKGGEYKRTTFAFPNLEPGDLVEYRWTQQMYARFMGYLWLYCQALVPTREYSLTVAGSESDFQVSWYNCENASSDPKKHVVTIRNLPAFVEEPLMPAQTEFRGWILVVLSHPFMRWYSKGDEAWNSLGEYLAEDFRLMAVTTKGIKPTAAKLVAGVTDPLEKIDRIYRFVQSNIVNFDWKSDPAFADKKAKRDREDEDQNAVKTLERGCGYPNEINVLFAALARAAGFEVRLGLSADRDELLNIHAPNRWMLANERSVAIKLGDQWRFYRPGIAPVPAHLLSAGDEGAAVFVCDEKKCSFQTTQVASASETLHRRKGTFTLDEEGTLDGDVEVEFTGHAAIDVRTRWWKLSTEDIAARVRETIVERIPSAAITAITCSELTHSSEPVIVRYHVHAPGYAQAIGTRFSFVPNFFEANSKEMFSAETRRYAIFFDYAETTKDDITLVLPEGYTLDAPSAPAPVKDPAGIFSADYGIRYLPKSRTLSYHRTSLIGGNGMLSFRAESYPVLKNLFGKIYRSDTHQLLIKPKTAAQAPAATETQS